MEFTFSIDGVPIRLTTERWFHIVENHDDVAGYYDDVLEVVGNPEVVLPGHNKARIAVRSYGRRRCFGIDYDAEADVLYISFQRSQKATNTQMTDDGLLLRYRGKQLVGITVLDASAHAITH